MANAEIEQDDDEVPKEGRGPAYPYLALEQAIERADKVREAGLARSALPRAAFFKLWEYKSASGPARQTIAALKYYNLVEYLGAGSDRKVRLTDVALRIVLDKVPNSVERMKALREAALAPTIFADLAKQFPFGIGTDSGIETYLTLNKGYSESAAKHIISVFRDTLRFSGLDKPDNLPPEERVTDANGAEGATDAQNGSSADPPPPPPLKSKGKLMEGERELTTGLLSKEASFRLIVSGQIGVKEIERLIQKLELDKEILADDPDADIREEIGNK